jgi:hypothetical protein
LSALSKSPFQSTLVPAAPVDVGAGIRVVGSTLGVGCGALRLGVAGVVGIVSPAASSTCGVSAGASTVSASSTCGAAAGASTGSGSSAPSSPAFGSTSVTASLRSSSLEHESSSSVPT